MDAAMLYSTDDNLYRILVNKMDTNVSFADSDFIFDVAKHPDVEVIDLR